MSNKDTAIGYFIDLLVVCATKVIEWILIPFEMTFELSRKLITYQAPLLLEDQSNIVQVIETDAKWAGKEKPAMPLMQKSIAACIEDDLANFDPTVILVVLTFGMLILVSNHLRANILIRRLISKIFPRYAPVEEEEEVHDVIYNGVVYAGVDPIDAPIDIDLPDLVHPAVEEVAFNVPQVNPIEPPNDIDLPDLVHADVGEAAGNNMALYPLNDVVPLDLVLAADNVAEVRPIETPNDIDLPDYAANEAAAANEAEANPIELPSVYNPFDFGNAAMEEVAEVKPITEDAAMDVVAVNRAVFDLIEPPIDVDPLGSIASRIKKFENISDDMPGTSKQAKKQEKATCDVENCAYKNSKKMHKKSKILKSPSYGFELDLGKRNGNTQSQSTTKLKIIKCPNCLKKHIIDIEEHSELHFDK